MDTLRRLKFVHLFFGMIMLFVLACGGISPLPSQEQPMEGELPATQLVAPDISSQETPAASAELNEPAPPVFNKPLGVKTIQQFDMEMRHYVLFAEDGQGSVHMIWNDRRGTLHSILDRDGNWSAEPDLVNEDICGHGMLTALDFQFLSAPDGNVCVVWDYSDLEERCWRGGQWQEPVVVEVNDHSPETGWGDFSAAFDPEGNLQSFKRLLSNPFSLNGANPLGSQDPEPTEFFKFVIDAGGGYHLVWNRSSDEPKVLWYKYSGDRGKTWEPAVPLTGEQDKPTENNFYLAADQLGNLHLAWETWTAGMDNSVPRGIQYRKWTRTSGWEPREEVFRSSWDHSGRGESSLSVDAQGHPHLLTLAYTFYEGDSHWPGLSYFTRGEDGRWTAASPVYWPAAGEMLPMYPAIFAGSDGVVHFTWVSNVTSLQYARYP